MNDMARAYKAVTTLAEIRPASPPRNVMVNATVSAPTAMRMFFISVLLNATLP